jgi:hypothetical protein
MRDLLLVAEVPSPSSARHDRFVAGAGAPFSLPLAEPFRPV